MTLANDIAAAIGDAMSGRQLSAAEQAKLAPSTPDPQARERWLKVRRERVAAYVAAATNYADTIADRLDELYVYRLGVADAVARQGGALGVRPKARQQFATDAAADAPRVAEVMRAAVAALSEADWLRCASWFRDPTRERPEPLAKVGDAAVRSLIALLAEQGFGAPWDAPAAHFPFDAGKWPPTVVARIQTPIAGYTVAGTADHPVRTAWIAARLASEAVFDEDLVGRWPARDRSNR